MILSITPNPALDETYGLELFDVGGSNRVAAPLRRAGGKGINVARVLHSQGVPVLALAPWAARMVTSSLRIWRHPGWIMSS
ncbi:hypothetical protein [Paeniglutamicibacter sp. Y32M11]|uniref:hypothetical protein n=1 Tax=Paeniglutamicibacter sp. Y32M11 TaxID=2853258 RepID=UPI00210763FC|nr:hypothetical protein [Paeniglutamicibacter sp. Y32M11]